MVDSVMVPVLEKHSWCVHKARLNLYAKTQVEERRFTCIVCSWGCHPTRVMLWTIATATVWTTDAVICDGQQRNKMLAFGRRESSPSMLDARS